MKTLIFVLLLAGVMFGQKPDTDTLRCYLSDTTQHLEIGSDFSHSTITFTPENYYFFTSGKSSLYIDTILVVDSGKVNLIPILKVKIKEFQDFWDQLKNLYLTFYAFQMAMYDPYKYPKNLKNMVTNVFKHYQEYYNKWIDSKPDFEGFELYLTDKQGWLDHLNVIKTEIGELK